MEQLTKGIDEGIQAFTDKYELEESVTRDLRQLLLESCKKHVKTPTPVTANKKVPTEAKSASKTRRKTGYNMYIKHQFDEAKKAGEDTGKTNSQDLMGRFSKEWKALSDEDKQPFMDAAQKLNSDLGVEPVTRRKGKKKLTGYNLYYRDNKDRIKSELSEGEKLMDVVGAQWRALTDEGRKSWNTRAADIPVEAETSA